MRRKRDIEALRGRILLVFQDNIVHHESGGTLCTHFNVSVSWVARELGVTRQAVYRACPELRGTRI